MLSSASTDPARQTSEGADPKGPWRIGVDIGGTFTDLVVLDNAGDFFVFKVPSTPGSPEMAIIKAVELAGKSFGISSEALLRGCIQFVHGSTVATNTLLERKGARVGMIVTEGFRDSIEIRRGIRENQWDHRAPFPEVLIPRYLRLPVKERVDSAGKDVRPLDRTDVTKAARTFREEGVEAIAICLINSYLNPSHEEAAAELLGDLGVSNISVSSRVSPIMGEYERSLTAVMNAYLAPKVSRYLLMLAEKMRALGLGKEILFVQSNGGALSLDAAASRPVNMVLSGPAAGVGALKVVQNASGHDDLILMEIGGTSCDVTLMSRGEVAITDEVIVDGYHLAVPSVDIYTVGAGGGTIAGVDGAGMLFAGPQGAGAQPGPAAYGLEGDNPTVTDASLVLGRLDPCAFAGGSIRLHPDLAVKAIKTKVADPLGIDVETAATGIIRLMEQNLLHAVERISFQRGFNPAQFVLVPAGGAGPMHGTSVGRALGCRRVYIPRLAGAFCALGMLFSDVRQEFMSVFFGNLDETETRAIEDVFARLEGQARSFLASEGFEPGKCVVRREFDLRYAGQQYSIRVGADGASGGDRACVLRKAFEAEHGRRFGHFHPGAAIEIRALRLIAQGLIDMPALKLSPLQSGTPEAVSSRKVWHNSRDGWLVTPIYEGAALLPGNTVDGPFIISEQTTTVLGGPGDRLQVDASGNFSITLEAS